MNRYSLYSIYYAHYVRPLFYVACTHGGFFYWMIDFDDASTTVVSHHKGPQKIIQYESFSAINCPLWGTPILRNPNVLDLVWLMGRTSARSGHKWHHLNQGLGISQNWIVLVGQKYIIFAQTILVYYRGFPARMKTLKPYSEIHHVLFLTKSFCQWLSWIL